MALWTFSVLWVLGIGTPVVADSDSSGTEKTCVKLYRQVNRAVFNEKEGERLMVGSAIEVDLPSDAGNEFNYDMSDIENADNRCDIRWADLFLQFDKIGKLSFGQGDTASEVVSQIDLSGTDLIGYYGADDQESGIFFYDKEIAPLSDTAMGSLIGGPDGHNRKDRFRYDTPKFSGVGVAISTFAEQDQDLNTKPAYDAALSYSGKSGDISMAAAIAYSAYPSDQKDGRENLLNGSASIAFSGFSITLAAGNERSDIEGHDSKQFYYGKVGYTIEFWQLGQTALAIDYGQYNEVRNEEDEAKTVGIMFVQQLQDWSTEIYAGFRTHAMDREDTDADAVNALTIGTRIRF